MENTYALSDLQKEELQVYELAISKGYITSSIIQMTLSSIKNRDKIINDLEEKGFLKKIPGIVPRYFAVTPIKDIIHNLEKFSKEYGLISKNIDELLNNQDKITSDLVIETENLIKGSMQNVASDSSNERKKAVEKIQNELSDFKKKILEISDQISSDIEEHETSTNQKLKEEIENEISKTKVTLDKETLEIVEKLKVSIEQLDTSLKAQQDSINTGLNQGYDELKTNLDSVITNINSELTSFLAYLSSNSTELGNFIMENVDNSANSIAQSLENAETVSKNIISEGKQNSQQILKKTEEESKKVLKASYEVISKAKEKHRLDLTTSLKDTKDHVQTSLNDLMSVTSNKSSELKNEMISSNEQLIKTSLETINAKNSELGNELIHLVNSSTEIIRNGSTVLKNVISKSIQEEIKNYKTKVIEALSKIQAEYLNRIELSGNEYETTFKNSINDKLVDIRTNLTKSAEEIALHNEKMTTVQNKIYGDFGENLGAKIEETSNLINNNFRDILKENIEKTDKVFDNSFNQYIKNTEDSVMEILSILSTYTTNLTEIFAQSGVNIEEGLNLEQDKLLASIEERVKTLKELTQNTVFNANQSMEDQVLKTKNSIEAKINKSTNLINSAGETLKSSIDKFISGINPSIENLPLSIDGIVSPSITNINLFIEYLSSSLSSIGNSLEVKYSTVIKGSGSKIKNIVNNYQNNISTTLATSKETINEAFESLTKLTEKASNDIETEIKKQLSNIQETLFKKVTEISSKLTGVISSSQRSISEPIGIMEETWNKFIDSDLFDVEKTWIIVGQDEIINYVNHMISRVKSSGFIVVPNFENLDWTELMKVHKKGRKFAVCTQLETVKNLKLLEEASESGIDLYSYSEKDFICFTRDNEEILIGVRSVEDETTAIISEVDPFVKHFSSMFNDYWRRLAKKYKPR